MNKRPLIGISPRLIPAHKNPIGPKGKSIQGIEPGIAHFLLRLHALPFMLPTFDHTTDLTFFNSIVESYIHAIDGLILQGGIDIHPSMYGERPVLEYKDSDIVRDTFEIALFKKALEKKIPILGICRGCQIMNVALGGTLKQEIIGTSHIAHSSIDFDENNYHPITVKSDSTISKIYSNKTTLTVNSLHHQAIDKLGENLIVEAISEDNIIEAIRHDSENFVLGVQWHPEFMSCGTDRAQGGEIFQYFISRVSKTT
jgi:putative glutamine amidotransferase